MNQAKIISLSLYQKRQAALLYYFSSIEFLDQIIERAWALAAFTDTTLDHVTRIKRDKAMRQLGWAEGHLSSNWSTYAHPMLKDCLRGLLEQKRLRATEWYDIAGARDALTGMSHFSMNWTLPEEEQVFRQLSNEARGIAAKLDMTVLRFWTDLGMSSTWEQYQHQFPKIPKFRVRTDVEGESGKRPVRTGVYMPQDDPVGTLQFAWIGNSDGALGPCETFSKLALEYLSTIGRDKLWRAPSEALRKPDREEPTDEYFDDWCRTAKRMQFPDEISARNERAYSSGPCRWYFVERIADEFEDETVEVIPDPDRIRCLPGEPVPRSGWWYSPTLPGDQGLRHFSQGSSFPDASSTEWGAVFWYFDANRQK